MVEIRPAVALALDLAFGPAGGNFPAPPEGDPNGVFEAAHTMVLAARIAARWPREALVEGLGPETASGFALARRRTGAAELQAEAVAEHIARLGAELALPLLFLKGAALVLEGLILPGSRGLGDVDVLTQEGRQQELQDRLKAEGCYEPQDLPCGEHQLQVLGHPLGLAVEVHLCLRGVRRFGQDSATFADLDGPDLTHPAAGLPGDARVPGGDLLLAHAVVHGLAQHGLNPKGYPMLRFVADIVDLDLAGAVESGAFERWMPWIERDVSRREVEALGSMCRRVVEGDGAAGIWAGSDDAALMLRHLVLGAVDAQYRAALRIRSLASALPSRGRGATLLRTVWGATVLTRGQVEALYGKPSSSWGYLGYRLYRPFDLIGRTFRYGAAAIKGRWR